MTEPGTVSPETVLNVLPFGLPMVDRERRIVSTTPVFCESLDLPPDAISPSTLVEDAIRASALRGMYGLGDPEAQVRAVTAADRSSSGRLLRRTVAGRSYDFYNTPLPDGGHVVSATETTALLASRADAEGAFAQTASQAEAEDEARCRTRLLDLVLLNIPHGIRVYGPDHRVTMFNDTYAKVMEGAPLRVGDRLKDIIRCRAEGGNAGRGNRKR